MTFLKSRYAYALALLGIAAIAPAQKMYGISFRTGEQTLGLNPNLYDVDPTTGAATGIGRLDPAGGASFEMYEGDLAFNPVTGVLWAMSTRVNQGVLMTVDLWVLDTTYPDASAGPARLMRVDPLTGTLLQSFVTSTTLGSAAGMTFAPNGDLLVADGDQGGTGNLYRVGFGTSTASLNLIGATGTNAGGGTIFEHGLSGLAYAPVPEPATMLALGAGVVAFARRRRSWDVRRGRIGYRKAFARSSLERIS